MMLNTDTYARYQRLGQSLRPVRGVQVEDQKYAYSYYHDNVQYVLNDFGEYEETHNSTDIDKIIDNLEDIVNSHRHGIVKTIYDHISNLLQLPVWVEVSTDEQLAVAFGSTSGVIANLIMDFTSPEKFKAYRDRAVNTLIQMGVSEDQIPDLEEMTDFLLISSAAKFDVLITDIEIDGVIVSGYDDDNFIDFRVDDDEGDDE